MNFKNAILIQARVGSSRLRSKVLFKINGLSILEIGYKILKRAKKVTQIIYLIPSSEENLILKKEIETGMKGIKDSMPEGFALDVNSLRKANEFKDKCYISLYYNFNPSSPGVNIIKLAVEQATKTNPVIIVINEVDTMYEKVYGVNHADTTRTAHTEDVNTFHSMIDALVGSPYIITIWTTNKTKEELDANEPNYKNFYRKGRVNFFLHMTAPNPNNIHEGDCIQTLTVPGITNSVGV